MSEVAQSWLFDISTVAVEDTGHYAIIVTHSSGCAGRVTGHSTPLSPGVSRIEQSKKISGGRSNAPSP